MNWETILIYYLVIGLVIAIFSDLNWKKEKGVSVKPLAWLFMVLLWPYILVHVVFFRKREL
jgi:hypothetical protein